MKIGIIEDNWVDLSTRYSNILQGNLVHVCLLGQPDRGEPKLEDFQINFLSRKGFYMQRFYLGNNGLDQMPVDLEIYFSDGLYSRCFEMVDKFGIGRVVVNTGDVGLASEAQKRGIICVEDSAAEYLARLDKK